MRHLQPYLIFPGTCEEALEHYAECLDGEIVMLQRYSESPLEISDEHAARIFNSVFRADGLAFMASDDLPGHEVQTGSNFSMFVTFSDPSDQERTFQRLAHAGSVLFPLEGGFGMVEDRFRVRWMLAQEGSPGHGDDER